MALMENSAAESEDPRKGSLEAAQEHEGNDRLSDFFARSQQRREQQESEPERFLESWFDPDPKALEALSERKHPITGYMLRVRGSKRNRANKKFIMRTVLAILADASRSDVSWDDVLAYPWHHVGPDEAQNAFRALVAKYPNLNTRHNFVQMLRSILKGCRDAKVLSSARYEETVAELPTTSKRGVALRRRRITPEELTGLMTASQQGIPVRAARDAAIIAVFATTGIRVSELAALDLAHWNQHDQMLHLAMTKNGRPHAVPVDPRTRAYLDAWISFRGTDPGPLFVSTARPSRCASDLVRLSTNAVRVRIQKIAQIASIGRLGTHDFRRTVASTLLRTTDASLVSRLLGHSSLAATLVYDMVTEDEQRTAISSLPLPHMDGGPGGEEDESDAEGRLAS